MLNFQIRNKDKIIEAFGSEHFDLLIKSLSLHFNEYNTIDLRLNEGEKFYLLRVSNFEKQEVFFEFYAIKLVGVNFTLAYNPLILI